MSGGNILVPLDGSAQSEAVLPFATAIAKAQAEALTLVSVVEPEGSNPLLLHIEQDSDLARSLHRGAQAYLDGVAGRLTAEGVTASTAIVGGVPSEQILRIASERAVSMIAMATHGRGGIQRWALGSVADKVMRLSVIPTLLVRPPETAEPARTVALERLLVPLDGSELAEAALGPAARLAQATGASLVLLRVEPWLSSKMGFGTEEMYLPNLPDLEEQAAAGAVEYLESARRQIPAGIVCKPVVLRGFPNLMIQDYVGVNSVDLVIMCTHGRGGLTRFVIGSKADALVRSGVPTLLVHPIVLAQERAEAGRVPVAQPSG